VGEGAQEIGDGIFLAGGAAAVSGVDGWEGACGRDVEF
jgi:hypothetical protein